MAATTETVPRVLLLTTLAETGGAQTYTASLVELLLGRFDVVVAAHGPGPLRDATVRAGVRFRPLSQVRRAIGPRDVLGLLELVVIMRRDRPDIVHANSSKAGVLGRLAAFLAGVPIRIFTVHGWAFEASSGAKATLYRWADRLVSPLTTVTICVAESERAAGLAARTCRAATTVVIPNAADIAEATPVCADSNRVRLVSVGRLQSPKDFVTLVRALARLDGRTFSAVIVGDGPHRAQVDAEVRTLGLADVVELAGERHDVPRLLAAADVFVLASRSEGAPLSILEAMHSGLPVVASRVGGVPDLVAEGTTGLLVAPGDPAALADALRRMIDDRDLRHRLGAAGRERATTLFDTASWRRSHLDVYRRELVRRGLPAPAP